MRGEISDRTASLESQTRFGRVAEWMVARPARSYVVFLRAAVLPLGLFFYSAGSMLREQLEERSRRVGTQTALLSAQLVEERFRQSTIFLEGFASRPLPARGRSRRAELCFPRLVPGREPRLEALRLRGLPDGGGAQPLGGGRGCPLQG